MGAPRWVCDPGKAARAAPAARRAWRTWARDYSGALSTELRVLFEILPDLSSREFRPIKQTSVARATHLAQPGVSKTLGRLVHDGYLQAGPRDGAGNTYRLNAAHFVVQQILSPNGERPR